MEIRKNDFMERERERDISKDKLSVNILNTVV